MRRMGVALVCALIVAGSAVGVAAADKPIRGCPDSFELMSIDAFRALLNSQSFFDSLPPEGQAIAEPMLAFVNSEAWLGTALAIDKNGDLHLCLKPLPRTAGNFYGWFWNGVDNTSNR